MQKLYELEEIKLVSRRVSEITSRSECDTSGPLGTKIPIMNAPMVDVANAYTASVISNFGGVGLLHRFGPMEDRVAEFITATYGQYKAKNIVPSIGIGPNCVEEFETFLKHGATTFCVDVANSSSYNVYEALEKFNRINSDAKFIIGNTMSVEGYIFYRNMSCVIAIRCGVAGGSACTTKNATGMHHPLASLIIECHKAREFFKNMGAHMPYIIADGGIKEPQDMWKALALGADFVMMGQTFAACIDSPAEFENGVKVYKGSASFENQSLYKETPKYIEGAKRHIEPSNLTILQTLERFQEGLQSSMSYANARNLDIFRRNVDIYTI
jgi:GMP reductase